MLIALFKGRISVKELSLGEVARRRVGLRYDSVTLVPLNLICVHKVLITHVAFG